MAMSRAWLGKSHCKIISQPFVFIMISTYLPIYLSIFNTYINNLRYEDTTPMAESEEELKSHLMGVKEKNEKAGSKPHM